MVVFIFVMLVILVLSVPVIASYTRVSKCNSMSCNHNNKKGKCILREVVIYDNKVTGLCLWHTDNMKQRLLDPLITGIAIGKKSSTLEVIDELAKGFEDRKAIKDPGVFEKWMKRHGMGKKD